MAGMPAGPVHIELLGIVEMADLAIAPDKEIGCGDLAAIGRLGEIIGIVAVARRGQQADAGPAAILGDLREFLDR